LRARESTVVTIVPVSMRVGCCNTAANSCVGGPAESKLVCDGTPTSLIAGQGRDGCGGTVDCGDSCSTFQAGWVATRARVCARAAPPACALRVRRQEAASTVATSATGCGGTPPLRRMPGQRKPAPPTSVLSELRRHVRRPGEVRHWIHPSRNRLRSRWQVPLYNVIVYVPDAAAGHTSPPVPPAITCSASVRQAPSPPH